jgi:RNA polymerase sigma-70 factor (ECF subfamily)
MRTDRELAEGVKVGIASAFDEMYSAYSRRLFLFTFSILKSREDAEEVVQNTFFKIWEQRKSIDSSQTLKAYIFTIAYHITIDILRLRLKEKKYREKILEKAAANYNMEESIEFGNLLERINLIVKELPPRKLEIYQLSRVSHLSYQEIATKLGISVKTVENGINYAMNFIKQRLEEEPLGLLLIATLFI